MVEVKNAEVFGLNRAVNAINNSFNVGEIDTTIEVPEKRWGTAKSLGNNMDPHQSHDAYLSGIIVDFDLLSCENSLYKKLSKNKYFTISPLKKEGYHINTNFRALKHFNLKYPEEKEFRSICSTFEKFSELTKVN